MNCGKEPLLYNDVRTDFEVGLIAGLLIEILATLSTRREELGISQKTLAKMSGIEQRKIRMLEKGNEMPTLDVVFRLARPLGLKLTLLPADKYRL